VTDQLVRGAHIAMLSCAGIILAAACLLFVLFWKNIEREWLKIALCGVIGCSGIVGALAHQLEQWIAAPHPIEHALLDLYIYCMIAHGCFLIAYFRIREMMQNAEQAHGRTPGWFHRLIASISSVSFGGIATLLILSLIGIKGGRLLVEQDLMGKYHTQVEIVKLAGSAVTHLSMLFALFHLARYLLMTKKRPAVS
jgi:hypothetical protein